MIELKDRPDLAEASTGSRDQMVHISRSLIVVGEPAIGICGYKTTVRRIVRSMTGLDFCPECQMKS